MSHPCSNKLFWTPFSWSPRFKVYNIDVTFDDWVTFAYEYDPDLGFGVIRPSGGIEGMAGVPILLLQEQQCSTPEVFYSTIRGIFFFGAEWMEFYRFPCFVFQLPGTMQACQSSFLDKIRQIEIPMTSYIPVRVDPNLDAYYLRHTPSGTMRASRYLELDKDHFTKPQIENPSRYFWPRLQGAEIRYAEHIPIQSSLPRDGLLAKGTDLRKIVCPLHVLRQRYLVPGVHTPFGYLGLVGTSFPWHLEDGRLYSISKHVFGFPKVWYLVSPVFLDLFLERFRQLYEPVLGELDLQFCEQLIHHKKFIAHPRLLNGVPLSYIPFSYVVQREGQIVVTLPNAPHMGFNCGPNIAVARNFATVQWVRQFIVQRPRKCLLPLKVCYCIGCMRQRCNGEMAFELLINEMSDLVFGDKVDCIKGMLPAISCSTSLKKSPSSTDVIDRKTPWLVLCVLTDNQIFTKLDEASSKRKFPQTSNLWWRTVAPLVDAHGDPLPLVSWHEFACKEEKRLADVKRDKFKLRKVVYKKNKPEVERKHGAKKKKIRRAQLSDPVISRIVRKRDSKRKAKNRLEKKQKLSE